MFSPKFHWTYVVIFLCWYLFSGNHDIKIEDKLDKPLEIQDLTSDSSTMENLPSQRELKFFKKVHFSNVHIFAILEISQVVPKKIQKYKKCNFWTAKRTRFLD